MNEKMWLVQGESSPNVVPLGTSAPMAAIPTLSPPPVPVSQSILPLNAISGEAFHSLPPLSLIALAQPSLQTQEEDISSDRQNLVMLLAQPEAPTSGLTHLSLVPVTFVSSPAQDGDSVSSSSAYQLILPSAVVDSAVAEVETLKAPKKIAPASRTPPANDLTKNPRQNRLKRQTKTPRVSISRSFV